MTRGTCQNCKAFNPIGNECRRRSPKPFMIAQNGQINVYGQWPATRAEFWCMDHVLDIQIAEAGRA